VACQEFLYHWTVMSFGLACLLVSFCFMNHLKNMGVKNDRKVPSWSVLWISLKCKFCERLEFSISSWFTSCLDNDVILIDPYQCFRISSFFSKRWTMIQFYWKDKKNLKCLRLWNVVSSQSFWFLVVIFGVTNTVNWEWRVHELYFCSQHETFNLCKQHIVSSFYNLYRTAMLAKICDWVSLV
jgi:hypothetical protein